MDSQVVPQGRAPPPTPLFSGWGIRPVPPPLAPFPAPGCTSPAAVDVVDLIVLVERHGLHAVGQGSIQHPDT